MITIYGLTADKIYELSAWFESEYWFTTLFEDDMQAMQNVILDENVVLKAWKDEVMIQFFDKKFFIQKEDFREITIE